MAFVLVPTFVRQSFIKLRQVASLHSIPKHHTTIRELMKLLHPDLFSLRDGDIQKRNMSCIQNMQEISGFFQEVAPQWKPSAPTSSIVVKSPLRDSYDMTCYIKDSNGDDGLTKIIAVIKTPLSLCERVVTTQQQIQLPVLQLIQQLSRFWMSLNISNPWNEILQSHLSSLKKDQYPSDLNKGIIQEMSESLFDHAIVQKHQNLRKSTSIFNNVQTTRHRKGRKHLLVATDKFVLSGNVRFSDVSTADESIYLSNFRSFLLDYGDLVNFNEKSWSKIFFIIHGSGFHGQNAYNVTASEDGFFFVNIPAKFSTEELLEILQEAVPNCNLL